MGKTVVFVANLFCFLLFFFPVTLAIQKGDVRKEEIDAAGDTCIQLFSFTFLKLPFVVSKMPSNCIVDH